MTPPRRWSFRFSLRTLFVVVTMVACIACACAWVMRQRQWIADREHFISPDQKDFESDWYFPDTAPPWQLRPFGARGYEGISLQPDATDRDVQRARELFPEAQILVSQ